MAVIAFESQLSIASGWNNTAGYSLITALSDGDSIPYVVPIPFQGLTEGTDAPRLSRRLYQVDTKVRVWTFQFITLKQIYKLDNDYQQTNDGKVTVKTVDFDGTFTDFNAYIALPRNWREMPDNKNGVGTYTPGNYRSNWIQNFSVAFNITGTAS